jgi:hypothetical protein
MYVIPIRLDKEDWWIVTELMLAYLRGCETYELNIKQRMRAEEILETIDKDTCFSLEEIKTFWKKYGINEE